MLTSMLCKDMLGEDSIPCLVIAVQQGKYLHIGCCVTLSISLYCQILSCKADKAWTATFTPDLLKPPASPEQSSMPL